MKKIRSKTFMLYAKDYDILEELNYEDVGLIFDSIYKFMNGASVEEVLTEYDDVNYYIKKFIVRHVKEKEAYFSKTLKENRQEYN